MRKSHKYSPNCESFSPIIWNQKIKQIKPPKIPKLFDKKEGTSFFPKNKKIRADKNGYPLQIQNKIFGGFSLPTPLKINMEPKITQLKRTKNLHDFGLKF